MSLKPWILAARPKTLPAAIAPVIVATALAQHHDTLQANAALWCLCFALLIQIATNYANDYFDFQKGTDNANRKGPARAVAQGWVSPRAMMFATIGVLLLALVAGLQLVQFGGIHLIVVGMLSMLFAVWYTGGPFPLAYLGLGDLFVLIFFGWVAVMYSYFVQAGDHHWHAFHLGTAVGCLSVNLLLVNNYRDYDNDRASGKHTTVVRFGLRYGRWQYRAALSAAALSTACIAWQERNALLLLSTLPVLAGFRLAEQLRQAETLDSFQVLLKQTAAILLSYAVLVSGLLILL